MAPRGVIFLCPDAVETEEGIVNPPYPPLMGTLAYMIQKYPNNNFNICALICRYVYAKPARPYATRQYPVRGSHPSNSIVWNGSCTFDILDTLWNGDFDERSRRVLLFIQCERRVDSQVHGANRNVDNTF